MKFSIIIPVYRVEDYLPACIQSVLNQTVSDYEVILVDDGSPDGCGAICDAYAEKDARFQVVHKKNGGLSSARNAGLDRAQGKYIYFLDSDDSIAPNLLETAEKYMDQGLDLLAFRYHCLKGDRLEKSETDVIFGEFRLETEADRLQFLSKVLVSGKIGWEAWSRVFVREKIEKYGLRFEDNRKIFAEDLYFSLCYLAHACRIRSISDSLYHYRIREDSIMGEQQARSNLGRISLLGKTVCRWYQNFDDCRLLTEQFNTIYYHLIAGQFLFSMWSSGVKPSQYRKLVREEVRDWDDMEQQLRQYLKEAGPQNSLEQRELRAHVYFLLGGPELLLRLRCRWIRIRKNRRKDRENG